MQRARPERDAMDEYENAINFNEQIMALPEPRRQQLMEYYRNDLVDPRTFPFAESRIPPNPYPLARFAEDAQGNPTPEYRNNILQMRADQSNPIMSPTRQERTFAGVFNRRPERVAPEPPLRQRLVQETIPTATEINAEGIPIVSASRPLRAVQVRRNPYEELTETENEEIPYRQLGILEQFMDSNY